jgi:hypothetical protein
MERHQYGNTDSMMAYETAATVSGQGEIRLVGLPFAPGTKVDVIVSPVDETGELANRTSKLFAALDKARNVDPLGTFQRDEIYDRDVLH